MKKNILFILFSLSVCICNAQEWFTSFDVAKRLALVQNKMLFVVWEASFNGSIPVLIKSDSGTTVVIDLANDTSLDAIIREYFVPVRLPESEYEDFIESAKGRGYKYINKLTDDSIKIMDVNGTILNIDGSMEVVTNFPGLIDKYALNTAFLNAELRNYSNDESYITSYLLAEKYIEYSIYSKKDLRGEIIDLGTIYLDESEELLLKSKAENVEAILQKIELLHIEKFLILNRIGKANRQLKRLSPDEIDPMNQRKYGFLEYTISMLKKDDTSADLWKSKISSLDLRKAEMILNILKHGNSN